MILDALISEDASKGSLTDAWDEMLFYLQLCFILLIASSYYVFLPHC